MHNKLIHQPPTAPHDPAPWGSMEQQVTLHHDNGWLISFIDILTILLTVFVLLLAFDHQAVPNDVPQTLAQPSPLPTEPQTMPQAEPGELSQLIQTLEQTLADDIAIDIDTQHITLEVKDNILFSPASAELTAAGLGLLQQLAASLVTMPYHISVEGHTDNTPIHTERYPSNWELSAARATVVTRALIEAGIEPGRLRAVGYGATRPLVENKDDTGKARNRRVSFILELPATEATTPADTVAGVTGSPAVPD